MSLKFPKTEKLKSRKAIKELFAEGNVVSKYPLKLLYLPKSEAEITKASVAVPKRNFKLAVTRNKIKRLVREAYRLHKSEFLESCDPNFILLFIYVGKDVPTYKKVASSMTKILKKLNEDAQKF